MIVRPDDEVAAVRLEHGRRLDECGFVEQVKRFIVIACGHCQETAVPLTGAVLVGMEYLSAPG
jgi:hypothetical protein